MRNPISTIDRDFRTDAQRRNLDLIPFRFTPLRRLSCRHPDRSLWRSDTRNLLFIVVRVEALSNDCGWCLFRQPNSRAFAVPGQKNNASYFERLPNRVQVVIDGPPLAGFEVSDGRNAHTCSL